MSTITIHENSPYYNCINWTDVTDDTQRGRDAVTYYEVRYRPDTSSAWTTLTTEGGPKMLYFEHNVTGGTMFPMNQNIYYRVCAKNGVGLGACSDITLLTDSTPVYMHPPTTTAADTTPTWIKVSWQELTDPAHTGRDPIILYDL